MAYSKKVVEKFENTLNEPEKNSVGRWNPSDSDIGTGPGNGRSTSLW